MIIKETLRMFPPASVIQRSVSKDTTVGGFKIQKGLMAIVNVFSLHYNEEIYKNPNEFRPERWIEDSIPSFAWIPFSIGSRVCIGNNFSLMEQKFFLGMLLRKFRFSLVEFDDILESPTSFLVSPLKKKIKFEKI